MPTPSRPRKSPPAPTTRTKSLIVLVFPEEHRTIKEAAAKRGLSMNAYIRSLALADARRAA